MADHLSPFLCSDHRDNYFNVPDVSCCSASGRITAQYNLINNAIKFTVKGSVTIRFSMEKNMLATSITDTGIGIEPADTDSIFDKFRQIETTLARKYEGTGLGLSICKSLVLMMGGEIWAESPGPEKGSIFTFTLPIARQEVKNGNNGIDH